MRHAMLAGLSLVLVSGSTPKKVFALGHVSRYETVESFVIATALEYGIDPELVFRVSYHESRDNPLAVGKNKNGTHDWGFMQLNDTTIRTLHVTHPLDYRQNVIAGVGLLAYYMDKYKGNTKRAVCAYAHGPGHCK